jgi:hypothetical protein
MIIGKNIYPKEENINEKQNNTKRKSSERAASNNIGQRPMSQIQIL